MDWNQSMVDSQDLPPENKLHKMIQKNRNLKQKLKAHFDDENESFSSESLRTITSDSLSETPNIRNNKIKRRSSDEK